MRFGVTLGLVIPFLAGPALSGGSVLAGLTAFVWAGLVRVFLLPNGRRPYMWQIEFTLQVA